MFRLLIVDDHPDQVKSLSRIVKSSHLSIGQIYECFNGFEALEIVQRQPVEIVLTDIRMPIMSGLELIAKIREISTDTKIIVLSGYSDFEYAQQAVQYQVKSYLLKPVNEVDLLTQLQDALDVLQRETDVSHIHQKWGSTYRENLDLMQGKLLNDLLQGASYTHEALSSKLSRIEHPISCGSPYTVMVVKLEGRFCKMNENDVPLIQYAVRNMAAEILGPDFDLLSCVDEYEHLVFMLSARNGAAAEGDDDDIDTHTPSDIRHVAHSLQSKVGQYLKGSISVSVVAKWGRFPEQLPVFYNTALSAFRNQATGDCGQLFALQHEVQPKPVSIVQSLYEPPLLVHLLESRQWSKAEEKLEHIFAELAKRSNISVGELQEVYFGILSSFFYIVHSCGRQLAELLHQNDRRKFEKVSFQHVEQLREWVFTVFRIIRGQFAGVTNSRDGKSLIERIHQFVELRLSEDVSVQSIADHVHFHPVYLSKLYKLETGRSIVEYILEYLMEKALFLLKNSKYRVYEIAQRLGYQTTHYFIKVFKQYYNITPQEFRESLVEND